MRIDQHGRAHNFHAASMPLSEAILQQSFACLTCMRSRVAKKERKSTN